MLRTGRSLVGVVRNETSRYTFPKQKRNLVVVVVQYAQSAMTVISGRETKRKRRLI